MFIQTEATPNPATLKFLPGKPVLPGGTRDYRDVAQAAESPLAQKLFSVNGVSGVTSLEPESLKRDYAHSVFTANDLYSNKGHYADFLECIRTRRRPSADVEIGCRTVTVCHLGNIAYELARPLRWDPDGEVFVNDAGANRFLDRARREPWSI